MKKLCLTFIIICYTLAAACIILLLLGLLGAFDETMSAGQIATFILCTFSCAINGTTFFFRYKEEVRQERIKRWME